MRTRKWVIFLVLVLASLSVLSIQGWRYFRPDEKFKQFILDQLRPLIGQNLDIEEIRLGLGTVHFRNIQLPSSHQQFSVTIKELRIGYNIVRLFSYGLNPYILSEDILLENPKIVFYATSRDTSSKPAVESNPSFDIQYENQVKKLKFIKRLSVIRGQIYLEKAEKRTLIAHSIKGLLATNESDSLEFRLEGNLFSSKKPNLNIQGMAELMRGNIVYAHISVDDYPIYEPLTFTSGKFKFTKGYLKGHFNLNKEKYTSFLNLSGQFSVSDGMAVISSHTELTALNLKAKIEKWNLNLIRLSCQSKNAKFTASGEIGNLLAPVFDINVKAKQFPVQKLVSLIGEKNTKAFQGVMTANMNMSGPANKLRFRMSVHSRLIKLYEFKFTDLDAQINYAGKKLRFKKLNTNLNLNRCSATGTIDFNTPERFIDGSLIMHGDFLPVIAIIANDSLKSCHTWLNAELGGQLNNPAIFGQAGLDLVHAPDDTLKMHAAFAYKDHYASLTNLDKNGSPAMTGRFNLKTSPVKFDAEIDNFQNIASVLWVLPKEDFWKKYTKINLKASGNINEFAVQSRINRIEGSFFESNLCNIQAQIVTKDEKITSTGQLTLHPDSKNELKGDFDLQKNRNAIILENLTIDQRLSLRLAQTEMPDGKHIDGQLLLDEMETNKLLGLSDTTCYGKLTSQISITGTSQLPLLGGTIYFDELFCYNGGPYHAEITFNLDSTDFALDRFLINSSDVTLIDANGRLSRQSDSLLFDIKGAGFDISALGLAAEQTKGLFSGQALIDVHINGTRPNPNISGLIAIKDGNVSRVPFDELLLSLGPSDSVQFNKTPGLVLNKIHLDRSDDFKLLGNGFIPFSIKDSLLLNLEGTGNFLSILTNIEPYFNYTESKGEFFVSLRGTMAKPQLTESYLQFSKGQMRFDSVVPKVTQLEGNITFEPNERFVHIHHLQGEMGGEWFRISNTIADSIHANRSLANMDLGEAAINLGVFIFESSKRGIPLNITGMMEKGDYGRLQLSGRQKKEQFYFSGPIGRPVLRGHIRLHDFAFRYPFDEVDTDDNQVVEFLETIEWDILVTPSSDVRYVNTIPGALDNVYTNIKVEEKFGGLEFSGQIEDESLAIQGQARSTAGIIEYLDMTFHVQQAGVEFDHGSIFPVVYGQARTTVTDSLGIPSQVMLTLQTVDQTMDKKPVDDIVRQEKVRGRWDNIRFKLTSDNPNLGTNEAQIMASLGYSTDTIQDKAFDALGIGTENMLFRKIYRPVERQLENVFSLDYVRFSSRFTRNFIAFNFLDNLNLNSRLAYLKSTKIVVGKYLANRVFLQYTGQVEAGIDYKYAERNIGLRHTLGLEYRINPKLLLELEYDYNSLMYENHDDKRIILRHWFPF